MEPVLELQGVSKYYDGFALRDVSLSVQPGTICGLIGPNGAGKTTLARLIMNLAPVDAGRIKVFGLDPDGDEKQVKNRIGFVSDESYLPADKSIAWVGDMAAGLFAAWDKPLFLDFLHRFGLGRRQKVGRLSQGEKTRLGFAVALSHGAEFFLLDEPTMGLDPVVRREILDLLVAMVRQEERTALISTHNTEILDRIADDVVVLNRGRVVLATDKDQLQTDWKTLHYRDGALTPELEDQLLASVTHSFGRRGVTDRFGELRAGIEGGLAAGEIKVENASLEDILVCLATGRATGRRIS